KIALSSSEVARLELASPALAIDVRRSAFESLIRPELDLVAATVDAALSEARLGPGDVDRVLLTGGSAYIPAFRRDLAEKFGAERLEQRDAFTAVVHGLGVRARELWGG